jgi:hypothetical protein
MLLRRVSVIAILVTAVALGAPVQAGAQLASCSATPSASEIGPGDSVTITLTATPDPIVDPYGRILWNGVEAYAWEQVAEFRAGTQDQTYENYVSWITSEFGVTEDEVAEGGVFTVQNSVDGQAVLCEYSITLASVTTDPGGGPDGGAGPGPGPDSNPGDDSAPAKGISLTLDFKVGDNIRLGNAGVPVAGSGLQPGSDYTVVLRSDPVQIGAGVNDASGAFSASYPVPADTPGGSHSVTVSSTDSAGDPVTAVAYFSLDDSGTVTAISYDAPTPAAPAAVVAVPTFTG